MKISKKISSITISEAEILIIIWNMVEVTVREVCETLLKKETKDKKYKFIPYTTVISNIDTLAKKGLLYQDKSAKTYIYSAAVNNKELTKCIIKSVAEKLL